MREIKLTAGPHGEPMSIGNTKLVEYGIFNEGSLLRAHVCVLSRVVYVFETRRAVEVIKNGDYKHVLVKTGDIVTATGYLVPPGDIPGCNEVYVPVKWWGMVAFKETENTSVKGNKAVAIVKWLLREGMFPLRVNPKEIKGQELQIKGLDIYVHMKTLIQVKCDYRGGDNGTGNLFIQDTECNPFGKH